MPAPEKTSPARGAPVTGRDDKGRFVRGNPGGPGNPFARKTAALRSALLGRMDEERMGRLADKLIEQALDGDVAAARLVLQYTVGKPTAAVDPDDVDRLEWEREARQVVPTEELVEMKAAVPVAVATLTRSMLRACQTAEWADDFGEQLDALDEVDGEEADEAPAPQQEAPAAPPSEPAEPVVIRLPRPVNQREKTARRCANPVRSATPVRQQTVISRGDEAAEPQRPIGGGKAGDSPSANGA